MLALLFDSNLQFQDKKGAILTGGILKVFYNSTTDKSAMTYSDASGSTQNPKEIILDNNGRATVYVSQNYVYRLEVYDSDENLLWTTRDIQPPNGVSIEGAKYIHIDGDEFIDVQTHYLNDHYYFDLSLKDLPTGVSVYKPWAENPVSGQLVVYGSRYPNYTMASIAGRDMGYLVPPLEDNRPNQYLGFNHNTFGLEWVTASPGGGGDGKVSVKGSDTPGYLSSKLVAAQGSSLSFTTNTNGQYVLDITESVIENPLLMTTFLMNENGNVGFTGADWGSSTGAWNSYGINTSTYYFRVTTLGRGTVSKMKAWNYNGTGKMRVCLMSLDGTIKAQTPWSAITRKGPIELDMITEPGQSATIQRNTDYWIGICAYGVQLVSYNKLATSFDGDSLRYSVCIRNGGQFPQTGSGWDNPNTDMLNSVPTGIPCIYMLAPENQ